MPIINDISQFNSLLLPFSTASTKSLAISLALSLSVVAFVDLLLLDDSLFFWRGFLRGFFLTGVIGRELSSESD